MREAQARWSNRCRCLHSIARRRLVCRCLRRCLSRSLLFLSTETGMPERPAPLPRRVFRPQCGSARSAAPVARTSLSPVCAAPRQRPASKLPRVSPEPWAIHAHRMTLRCAPAAQLRLPSRGVAVHFDFCAGGRFLSACFTSRWAPASKPRSARSTRCAALCSVYLGSRAQ